MIRQFKAVGNTIAESVEAMSIEELREQRKKGEMPLTGAAKAKILYF